MAGCWPFLGRVDEQLNGVYNNHMKSGNINGVFVSTCMIAKAPGCCCGGTPTTRRSSEHLYRLALAHGLREISRLVLCPLLSQRWNLRGTAIWGETGREFGKLQKVLQATKWGPGLYAYWRTITAVQYRRSFPEWLVVGFARAPRRALATAKPESFAQHVASTIPEWNGGRTSWGDRDRPAGRSTIKGPKRRDKEPSRTRAKRRWQQKFWNHLGRHQRM